MRTPESSSRRFRDFEFNDDDERIERISKKILGKFGNPKSDHSPVTKYKFLQCFAHGTKTKQMDVINEILDVDADDDAVKGGISGLDAVAPTTCPKYVDSGRFFSGVKSYPARALNHGVTSTSSKYLDSNLPQFLSDNEPVSINSDDDERMELSSSTSASDFAENEGPLEEQVEHRSDGCDTSVVVSPDYVIYGDTYCTKSWLTFSCRCIRVEGSAVCGIEGPFSFEWTVDDIINIESQWCGWVQTAVVNLRLKSKETKVAENGIAEFKFAVFDPDWFERQEAIQSLDVRYKAKWNIVSDIDTARREDACLGSNNIFISKHYFSSARESFEDVIYPKGDPDAVSISKRDIELLQPETFINDTIIDFYIKYLKSKIKPEEKDRFHFFNSFFFRKLADLDKDPSRACEGRAAFQRVHKWTRKVNLFEKDYIFIPVNFSLHWSLIVICHPGDVTNIEDDDMEKLPKIPCILHMDSMKGSHRGLKNLIKCYLWEEWKARQNQLTEDVSSKFLNLQFVPLELPQQENSFDCGLFLLHYVELFLERAPVDFSPFQIRKFSNFLNKDWFPPAEASHKRARIKKLICDIVEHNFQRARLAPCNDDKCPSELPPVDERDTDVEFLQKICNSTEPQSLASPLRAVQCSKEPQSVFREELGPRAVGGLLFDGSYQSFGQMVPLNRLKNVMSPIEETEETPEHLAYSPTDKAGGQQPSEVSEPSTPKYSAKGYSMLEASSFPVSGSTISSEVGVNEGHLPEEYLGSNPAGEKVKSESPSTSTAWVVDDSEEEDEIVEVNETKTSPFHLGKILGLTNQEIYSTDNIVVQANNIPLVSESEERMAAKRPRHMPPKRGRRLLKSLSKDLY